MAVKVLILDVPGYHDLAGPVSRSLALLEEDLGGKRILVKPNILSAQPPEKGVDTHPALVREVVKQLKQAGAEVWVGDNSGIGGYGANEKSARVSGIMEAASDCYRNLARRGKSLEFKSRFADRIMISSEVLEADLVISLPKFKTHTFAVLTGAVKNTFGYVVGGDKTRLHHLVPDFNDFGEMLVDVFMIRPPDLSIMDAVVAMEGNGPNNAPLRQVGKILASRDAVALDRVMAEMAGAPVSRVPFLRAAGKRGVGEVELERIEVEGKWERIPGYKLPLHPGVTPAGILVNRFIIPFLRGRPVVDRKSCIACGDCVRACPEGAIEIRKWARVDNSKCIRCYCCNEVCTQRAIKVGGRIRQLMSWRRRLFSGKKKILPF